MRQVLFYIPLRTDWTPHGIPIYGFGLMLFVAFLVATWLAGRRARQEGVPPERIQDLAIWIFIGGLIGARVVYMIQYRQPLEDFFRIWEGGLVFYGSAIGGVVGYFLAYWVVVRRHRLSGWQIADIIAPSAALGLAIGRLGCLFNGCCYGDVACPDCVSLRFPIQSPPWFNHVRHGLGTAAGFTLGVDRTVAAVEPDSPAAQAGLRAGDVIVQANDRAIADYESLWTYLARDWPRGETQLRLTVRRGGEEIALPPFAPRSLGVHPTQLYETISALLLFLLLTAYYPLKRREGEVMILFMVGYAVHRFLNEMLRNDTDPVAFGMTLSQNGSLLVLAAAALLGGWVARQSPRPVPKATS
ncbi:MAG: prolipoprotein diacylglyceryl transferase [Gemmataceae bacterium]|nr:prolipoprotein diacylglyceryl transferase [Gemmataceae bacterium]MDW8267447.1 prolipoprotein diacylglyceryl transferase [Gemmataceae bacterium]